MQRQSKAVPQEIREAIGARVRQERRRAGVTQIELAELLNWESGQSRVSSYERGAQNPRIDELKDIANALDISLLLLISPILDDEISLVDMVLSLPAHHRAAVTALARSLAEAPGKTG